MRRLVPLSLLAPLAALLAGCQDPARPTGVTPPAAALASTDPMSKVHPLPTSLEQKVQRFRADLEANGYEVARGYWTLWSNALIHSIHGEVLRHIKALSEGRAGG